MKHRPARVSDLPAMMALVADARRFLKCSDVDQWQGDYPARADFEEDVRRGACEVFFLGGALVGMISILPGPETDYTEIFNGAWLSTLPYCSLHRAAVAEKYRGHGIAMKMFSIAESLVLKEGYRSIRADTHRDNRAMRGLLEKRDFTHCGTVYLDGQSNAGFAREAYEKLL